MTKKNTKPWHCPKGATSYSTHRWVEVSRKQIRKGVFDVKRRCKLCGKTDTATLDYVVLSDILSFGKLGRRNKL
jgi:hypothetical protein